MVLPLWVFFVTGCKGWKSECRLVSYNHADWDVGERVSWAPGLRDVCRKRNCLREQVLGENCWGTWRHGYPDPQCALKAELVWGWGWLYQDCFCLQSVFRGLCEPDFVSDGGHVEVWFRVHSTLYPEPESPGQGLNLFSHPSTPVHGLHLPAAHNPLGFVSGVPVWCEYAARKSIEWHWCWEGSQHHREKNILKNHFSEEIEIQTSYRSDQA